MQERALARGRGLLLYEEGSKSDGFMSLWCVAHRLAHVGANMRLPVVVGPRIVVVDIAHRVGQSKLLRIPVVVRKSLV